MANHRVAGTLGFVLMGALALSACAPTGSLAPQLVDVPMETIEPDVSDGLTEAELEAWGYDGDVLTVGLSDLMNDVTGQYGTSDGFSGFEWSRETSRLTLWWYGSVPAELDQQLASHDPSVTISTAQNPPKELAEAVRRIMTPGAVPGVFVSGAGPSIECTHLSVMAEATDPAMPKAAMSDAIERVAGFPIELEMGRIVPISGTVEGR